MSEYPCPPLKSAPASPAYREGFDRIFGQREAARLGLTAAPVEAKAPNWRRDENGLHVGLGNGRTLTFVQCADCQGLGALPVRESECEVDGDGYVPACQPCMGAGWFLRFVYGSGQVSTVTMPA